MSACFVPDFNRPHKNTARGLAMPTVPVKNSLWMPSANAYDVKMAMQRHLLLRGKHFFVEEKSEYLPAIRKAIDPWRSDFRLIHSDLRNFAPDVPLDYAFIDLYGSLDIKLSQWVRQTRWSKGAEVSMTLCLNPRGSQMLSHLYQQCKESAEFAAYYAEECCHLRRKIYQQLCERVFHNMAIFSVLIQSIFRDYSFEYDRVYCYKDVDHQLDMGLFKVRKLRPYHGIATIPDVLLGYKPPEGGGDQPSPQKPSKPTFRGKIIMTETTSITGIQVATAMISATTTGKKAAATRLFNNYVTQQVASGKGSADYVRRGVRALMTRLTNQDT